jgi:uncharacterized protein (DUF885 family)
MTAANFADIAARAIEAHCATHPDDATFDGEHAFDDRLADPTPAAARTRQDELARLLSDLADLDTAELRAADQVDVGILRSAAESESFSLADLHDASWDPMQHNPGQALYALLSRDFAPLADRLSSLSGRLAKVPDYLAGARERLDGLSAIHTETAINQLDGVLSLIDMAIPEAVAGARGQINLEAVRLAAATAVRGHQDWLREQLPHAQHSARLGEELFARKLELTLATVWKPKILLKQAYRDLERVEHELVELVGRGRPGERIGREQIAAKFNRLSADAPTSDTILQTCRNAFAECTAFVAEHDLLTLFNDPVEIIEMPEIDRGVAVAYCRGVGALETAPLLTQFAVSPTPLDWSAERVSSFYREYNNHMLHNLTVHEAMPGHVEQFSHSRRYQGATKVRSVFSSVSFTEGWAVYAEQLMTGLGYRSAISTEAALAVRMQQLKMRLRMILNTILDISFHTGDLDERAAMELMTVRGCQEDGEAAGKWRRVQLTSTQLCMYYMGYLEVSQLAADLRTAQPDWSTRQVHDSILSFGSPPVRHLRSLLGLSPTG